MNKLYIYFPYILIACAVFFAVMSMVNDSQIVDEIPHVGAGYSYVVKQDMRLNPEHPPLVKDLAALPMLFMDIKQTVFSLPMWTTGLNDQWEFGRRLIYNSGNDGDVIKFYSRLPMLLFYIFAALIMFKWGTELYGNTGGILALILFLFSPTVMAHSRFVTTDVPALFGILASIYTFTRYLGAPTKKNLIIAGVMFGLALLMKFSTFLLGPFFVGIALIHGILFDRHKHGHWKYAYKPLIGTFFVFLIGFLGMVWPIYGFHVLNYPVERQLSDTTTLLSSFGNRLLADPVVWMADKPFIRAIGQYLLGFLMVVQRSAGGNTIYFLGEVKNQGGPLYFPLVYFIKEPLAWWALVFVAFAGGAYRLSLVKRSVKKTASWVHDHFAESVMLAWMAFYWFISIRSTLNIGIRHMLPTFPFAILLVSGQITHIAEYLRKHEKGYIKVFSLGVASLLGWYIFENIRIFPYYLTYFNQSVGGAASGHKYVADSNLDWGQDLKRLTMFVEQQKLQGIELDYFGWADPRFYLGDKYVYVTATTYKDKKDFLARNRTNGWIAISATFFQQASSPNADNPGPLHYTWLKSYEPVAVIGNSIFVWHITK